MSIDSYENYKYIDFDKIKIDTSLPYDFNNIIDNNEILKKMNSTLYEYKKKELSTHEWITTETKLSELKINNNIIIGFNIFNQESKNIFDTNKQDLKFIKTILYNLYMDYFPNSNELKKDDFKKTEKELIDKCIGEIKNNNTKQTYDDVEQNILSFYENIENYKKYNFTDLYLKLKFLYAFYSHGKLPDEANKLFDSLYKLYKQAKDKEKAIAEEKKKKKDKEMKKKHRKKKHRKKEED